MIRKLFRVVCGGGDDGPNPNHVTPTQAELWRQEAIKWNKFIGDIEPRQEAAFKTALESPENTVTGAVKGAVYEKMTPTIAAGGQPNTKQFITAQDNLGGALSRGEVTAREAAKDYKANTISNILATKLGEKPAIQQGLTALAGEQAKSFMDTATTNQKINTMNTQAGSSALGSLATGTYSGYRDTSYNKGVK